MSDIVLATCNASYSHPSFGLRCLRANLGELRDRSVLVEFDRRCPAPEAAGRILDEAPRVVGLGVYVWNAAWSAALVRELKARRPDLPLVLGGPEVSHETAAQPAAAQADAVVCGEGEEVFPELCRALLGGGRPGGRVVRAPPPDLARLRLPYGEYAAEDAGRRTVYVETSRGCPFRCDYCLSALDRGVRAWPLEPVLAALDRLLAGGAARVKFIDRTFNADAGRCVRVLDFLLPRLRAGASVQFEVAPRRLPGAVRDRLRRFPAGALRFEVGVQTWDAAVARRVRRPAAAAQAEALLRFLRDETGVVVHADLIAGLPGETPAAFARGFDRLYALGPAEVQVGLLKRLRGAPLARHDAAWGMVYGADPPREVLATRTWPREDMDRTRRFARHWERLANRRRFPRTLGALLGAAASPHAAFDALAGDLHAALGAAHGVALDRCLAPVHAHLVRRAGWPPARAARLLAADYAAGGRRRVPGWLAAGAAAAGGAV